MIDLQKMCLSWATANDCAADWLWLLEQAKDVVNATTVEALFLKKVAAQVPAHCKPTMRRLRDNLLQERMQWVDVSVAETLQKVLDNKVLPNVTKLTKEDALAFANQETFHDWAVIAKCCASWVRQSEEFMQQEAWVKMGWKALLIYQVEPMSAARKNTRRHTPVLYRHVPISGGENRANWAPSGYVVAADEKMLHGWNLTALILSALALIKYPDSPFYEGPLTDGFWLLKAAQETRVHCTDPLALVAMLEQFNYVVPVKQVRGPDIKIVPVEPANDNKKKTKKQKKLAKKLRVRERVSKSPTMRSEKPWISLLQRWHLRPQEMKLPNELRSPESMALQDFQPLERRALALLGQIKNSPEDLYLGSAMRLLLKDGNSLSESTAPVRLILPSSPPSLGKSLLRFGRISGKLPLFRVGLRTVMLDLTPTPPDCTTSKKCRPPKEK